MLTLSGAPDRVVSWSDFSLQHKTVRKPTGSVVQLFQAFTGFVILVTCCPLWLLSHKQQSLAYSNMCHLLWSYVEFRIVFFLLLPMKLCDLEGIWKTQLHGFTLT